MKASEECYSCLARLVRQAAELATKNPGLRARAIKEGLRLLKQEFSKEKTTIAFATPLHRLVKLVTGNTDPYRQMKETEVLMAEKLYHSRKVNLGRNLKSCLIFAVQGNAMDFFKDQKSIKEDLERPVEFTIDNTEQFEKKLEQARSILYLADNAGEVFFDLPLVRRLQDFSPVTYVVKESPVQDDITLADLEEFGLAKQLPKVITTGTDSPGVDMTIASDEFKAAFYAADLVVAKGMGYWETLSELPAQRKTFYVLKAKCNPVANALSVPLDSYVALLR